MQTSANSENTVKRKKILLVFLIALVVIVFVTASILILSKLLDKPVDKEVNNDISGAWELVVNPELSSNTEEAGNKDKVYYVFDSPDKYGRGSYYTCYQGGIEYFKYELLEEDSIEKINLGTENLEYKITGSKAERNAKLTIIYPEQINEMTGLKEEASEYVFSQSEKPDYEKYGYEEFSVDKSLFGTRICKERTLSYNQYTYTYTQSVEFKDNGIMIIHYKSTDLMLDRYMYYAYSADGSEIVFSLVTDKDTKYTVTYTLDESGNLKFTNDNSYSSIFADEIFGNFTFCTSENLPETTE